MKSSYLHKLDSRLGVGMLFGFACTTSILLIYGLYHTRVHGPMLDYLDALIEASNETSIEESNFSEVANSTGSPNSAPLETTDNETSTLAVLTNSPTPETQLPTPPILEGSLNNMTTIPSDSTTPSSSSTDEKLEDVLDELVGYKNALEKVQSAIWLLFVVGLAGMGLLTPAIYFFHTDCPDCSRSYRVLAQRVITACVAGLMVLQLLYCMAILFPGSWRLGTMLQRLFVETSLSSDSPTSPPLHQLEERLDCEFENASSSISSPSAVLPTARQPCVPKLRDHLFPLHAVALILLFGAVWPLSLAIFTYAWNAWLKELPLVKTARWRVELNREQQLSNT